MFELSRIAKGDFLSRTFVHSKGCNTLWGPLRTMQPGGAVVLHIRKAEYYCIYFTSYSRESRDRTAQRPPNSVGNSQAPRSSSSSSSTFISRPTPLRAYAVLTTGGAHPPMIKPIFLSIHWLHPSKLRIACFFHSKEWKNGYTFRFWVLLISQFHRFIYSESTIQWRTSSFKLLFFKIISLGGSRLMILKNKWMKKWTHRSSIHLPLIQKTQI